MKPGMTDGFHDSLDAGIAAAVAGGGRPVAASRLPAAPMAVEPLFGRIAADDRSAGFLAVASIAERLSRTAGSASLAFDGYLRDLCIEFAAVVGRSGGPTLSCSATGVLLPVGPAVTLGLIAEQLVLMAFDNGFPIGRGGRIAVSFTALSSVLELTVEDSGIAAWVEPNRRLLIVRLLALQLDGTLETETGVIAGTRRVVTIPRPQDRVGPRCERHR